MTVLPVVQVRFARTASLEVAGGLRAVGTAAAPVVFTGTTAEPGWWSGIAVRGPSAAQPAQAALEHVVVERGGRFGANVYAHRAQVSMSHATVRHSSADGLRIESDGLTSTVQLSRIEDNAAYGIRSSDRIAVVLAANNWWGAASGPSTPCNPRGTGSRVTPGVAFRPSRHRALRPRSWRRTTLASSR